MRIAAGAVMINCDGGRGALNGDERGLELGTGFWGRLPQYGQHALRQRQEIPWREFEAVHLRLNLRNQTI